MEFSMQDKCSGEIGKEHYPTELLVNIWKIWGVVLASNNRMGKTRDLFKKIRNTKGTYHAKMGTIRDRNGMDLTKADIKKRWQKYTESEKVKVKVMSLSRVWLFVIPWTVVYQASLSMGFSRQVYWSGLPFPSPGDLPDPGIEPRSPALQADALPSEPPGKPTEELYKKDLCDPDNHHGVIPHLEPDILECKVKWASGSITTNKASGGDGIPIELFQILKDDAIKVLHSVCQQIWKTQK